MSLTRLILLRIWEFQDMLSSISLSSCPQPTQSFSSWNPQQWRNIQQKRRGITELLDISCVATTLCAALLSYLIEMRYNPLENHLFDKSYKCFSYSVAVFAFSDYLTRQCSVQCTSVGRSHEIFTVPLTQGQIV